MRHIPEGVIDVWGNWDQPGKTVGPYLHYGYGMANFDMGGGHPSCSQAHRARRYKALAHAVATNAITGRTATRCPTGRHARLVTDARRGRRRPRRVRLLGILISRRFGTHVRLGSIITNAPLTVDPMYAGPPLCEPEACDYKCVRICPVNAFSTTEDDQIRIGDRVFHKARHDNIKCGAAVSGITKGSGSRSEVCFRTA